MPLSLVALWDIDGTLLTTARAGVGALEDASREVLGRELDLAGLRTAGLTDAAVARLAIQQAGQEPADSLIQDFLRVYERNLPRRLPERQGHVLPGVTAILDRFRSSAKVHSTLLTGNTAGGAAAKLQHYGLSRYFTDGAFCDQELERTGIAEKARQIVQRTTGLSDPGSAAVVIGDTPHDIRCGKAIGARTIGVATGGVPLSELERESPTYAIAELPDPERFESMLALP